MDRERMFACTLAALAPLIRDGRRALLENAEETDDLVRDLNLTAYELHGLGQGIIDYTGFIVGDLDLLRLVIAGPTIGAFMDLCLERLRTAPPRGWY
jgi:hypothetical protein